MTYQPEKSRTALVVVLSVVALLVVGGVVAAVLATSGVDRSGEPPSSRESDPDTVLAESRDAAIEDGTKAAETLNTLDHRTAEEDLDRWESVATGPLHDELVTGRDKVMTQVAEARTTTEATVLTAGLAEFDPAEGKARLLVIVRIEITRDGAEATTKQSRLSLALVEVPDGWKVSDIDRK